jgi:hypothetical protein
MAPPPATPVEAEKKEKKGGPSVSHQQRTHRRLGRTSWENWLLSDDLRKKLSIRAVENVAKVTRTAEYFGVRLVLLKESMLSGGRRTALAIKIGSFVSYNTTGSGAVYLTTTAS